MPQHLGLVSIVVWDYDQAIAFYVGTLGFLLVEDTRLPEPGKRWVGGPEGGMPCNWRSKGLTKSKKVMKLDTGLPGKPTKWATPSAV